MIMKWVFCFVPRNLTKEFFYVIEAKVLRRAHCWPLVIYPLSINGRSKHARALLLKKELGNLLPTLRKRLID